MTFVPEHDPPPLYESIADRLRAGIGTGEYPPGQQLPSETSLAAENDVSKDTIRDAFALLRNEGLIVTRRGYRARVRDTSDRTALPLPAGAEIIARMPTPDESRLLEIEGVGVPVYEVRLGSAIRLYRADRHKILIGEPHQKRAERTPPPPEKR